MKHMSISKGTEVSYTFFRKHTERLLRSKALSTWLILVGLLLHS